MSIGTYLKYTFLIMIRTDVKELFYEKLANVYEEISRNVIQIILDELNMKCGHSHSMSQQ